MGMFDDVLCEQPLPDGYEGTFQSKDFECLLDTYKISTEGRLLRREYKWAEDADAPLGIRKEPREWVDTEYHGIFRFYDYAEDKSWHEYEAKFTDGQLVEITQVPEVVRADA